MPQFTVIIPNWSEGKSLRIDGIEVASPAEAKSWVVDWVNRLAGRHYCDDLPAGTIVKKQAWK